MKLLRGVYVIGAALYLPSAFAQDTDHILGQLTSLMPFAVSIAYMIGLFLSGLGLYRIYKQPSNPQQFTIATSLRYLLAGTLLLSVLTAFNVLTRTTIDPNWSGSERTVLALDQRALQSFEAVSDSAVLGGLMPDKLGAIIIGFVYFIGFVSFIRGLYLIKEIGQNNSQNGSGVGKVLTHLIGGVIAMNLTQTACVLGATISTSSAGFC